MYHMNDEEVRRCRAALRSQIGVLLEAHRRLIEAEAPAVHVDAARPSTGNDGQLAAGPLVAGSSGNVSSHHDGNPVATDYYPLDEPEEDATQLDTDWAHRLFNELVYSDMGGLHETREAASGHHGNVVRSDSDPYYYDDDDISQDLIDQAIVAGRLHIPHIEDTPAVFNEAHANDGFGGIPASAAAIKALRKQKYDGSGTDSRCVICMRDYKKGKRLVVMPCEYTHRFHGKCLKKWLLRSHLCPLCRHALPTEEKNEPKSTNVST